MRSATVKDVDLLLTFLQKKAAFDQSVGAFTGTLATTDAKIRQTIFGEVPFAHVLFAEVADRPVGFALYWFRYSSFAGQPSLWLDDLFIDATERGQGIGKLLMAHLTRIARQHNCTHLGWNADTRNINGIWKPWSIEAKSSRRRLGEKLSALNPFQRILCG